MKALDILKQSLLTLIANPRDTLRVFGLPLFLYAMVIGLGDVFFVDGFTIRFDLANKNTLPNVKTSVLILKALGLLVIAMFWVWGAVAWHRYILLGERPIGLAPKPKYDRIISYSITVVALWAIVALVTVVFGMIFAYLFSTNETGASIVAAMFAVQVAWSISVLGLSTLLPARATNSKVGFVDVIAEATLNIVTLILLSIMLANVKSVANFLIELITISQLREAVELPVHLIGGIVVISIATTLYRDWFADVGIDKTS